MFSTPHRMVRLRSSLWSTTDPVWRDLFLNAHYHGFWPQQLEVFWSLLLQADSEGPTLISCTASWRTTSNISTVFNLAQQLWYLKTLVAKSVGVFFLLPLDDICNIREVEVLSYLDCWCFPNLGKILIFDVSFFSNNLEFGSNATKLQPDQESKFKFQISYFYIIVI